MVNAEDFRRIALDLPGAEESSHMNHPDFRVGGKIFATLGYPDEAHGMVKLRPEQQESLCKELADGFAPVKGGWGRQGATQVRLENVNKTILRRAITLAYRNVAPKGR